MIVTAHGDVLRQIKGSESPQGDTFFRNSGCLRALHSTDEVLRKGEQCGNENNVVSVAATERDDRSDRRRHELALARGQGTTGTPVLAGAGTLAAQPGDAPCPGETLRRPLPGVTGQKHY